MRRLSNAVQLVDTDMTAIEAKMRMQEDRVLLLQPADTGPDVDDLRSHLFAAECELNPQVTLDLLPICPNGAHAFIFVHRDINGGDSGNWEYCLLDTAPLARTAS